MVGIIYVFAVIVGIITIVIVILIVVKAVKADQGILGTILAFVAVLYSSLTILGLLVASEYIKVLVDIEYNTRKANEK